MNKRILLADDTESIIEIQKDLLRRFSGYEIEAFSDGASLKGRLERDVGDVVLVVTDNEMPGANGSKIIAEYARKYKFPFVLVYGGVEEIGEQAVENGAFGYLTKPFGFLEYTELIGKALGSK